MSSRYPENLTDLGMALRKLREDKGLLLRQAAAEVDMDSGLLGNIERGKRLPTENQIHHLAALYREDRDKLLAARACCDFRQRYSGKEFYGQCLQILNEEASKYG